ncbi:MAG: hypothetical protein AAB733_01845 [Patescibacteria group bacterium]
MKSRVYDAALLILCAIALFIFAFMLNQIPPFSPESLFVNQWDTTLQTALPREATIAWWSPKCLPHPLQRLNFFLYPRRLRCFSYHETNDLLSQEPYDDPYLYILLEKPIQGNIIGQEKFEAVLDQESYSLLKRTWK